MEAGMSVVESVAEKGGVPDLAGAQVMSQAAAGWAAPRSSALCASLPTCLGGAVGATRAVVDMGWIPYAYQIGQTGKTVRPKLYVAVGISGEIQHKVGMQTSGMVVAINKDPNAPIFQFSDLGIVGIRTRLSRSYRGDKEEERIGLQDEGQRAGRGPDQGVAASSSPFRRTARNRHQNVLSPGES